MIEEKLIKTYNGYWVVGVLTLIAVASIFFAVQYIGAFRELSGATQGFTLLFYLVYFSLYVCLWVGFFNVQPNKAKVLQLFGKYVGSSKTPGLQWANPLYKKTSVSLRTRNFETNKLKVNDREGNPIEIAAVVVWSIVDSAEAVFEVDNCVEFVGIQSESALRNLATSYNYDTHDESSVSLRCRNKEVVEALKNEMQKRLTKVGVKVHEARITHLAYAPEIAQAMLQRQQAGAIIAARSQIVEGAVSMVEMALHRIEDQGLAQFDEERKASMISNLLVVLCGDNNATPVINTGTIYS